MKKAELMLQNPVFRAAMQPGSQQKRRGSLRLAWVIGVLAVIWYLAAMFLLVKS